MRLLRTFLLLVTLVGAALAKEVSQAQQELQSIISRQQLLFLKAGRALDAGDKNFDESDFRTQAQDVEYAFEDYLKKYPDVAAGYAALGEFFRRCDDRKRAMPMFLKANKLDPNLPFVKNQIGCFLAEEGKPIEAVNYFLAAIKLEPNEPLYHYQLGTLLIEARDEFLLSGAWTRSSIDNAMLEAFRRAAELAPERIEFTYRYGESFYDLEKPDWDAALKVWSDLEEKLKPGVEKQTIRLHCANILIKQNKIDHAKALLAMIDEEVLKSQKEKLIAQLPENAKK
jgi:tetratricopeptide (TPR) repeat protein